MDFISLKKILPKTPEIWNEQDTQIWLDFIGLGQFKENFKNHSIDGSCLNLLNEVALKEDLKINSSIIRKKIMNWITKGLKQYALQFEYTQQDASHYKQEIADKPCVDSDRFEDGLDLFSDDEEEEEENIEDKNVLNPFSTKNGLAGNLIFEEKEEINKFVQPPINAMKKNSKNQPLQQIQEKVENKIENIKIENTKIENLKNKQNQPSIQQLLKPKLELCLECNDTEEKFKFVWGEKSYASIGRHSQNSFVLMDETVSRFHAEFGTNSQGFWIKDLGSTTGTFRKLNSYAMIPLKENLIIEMGLNQFMIKKLGANVEIDLIEGPNEGQHLTLEIDKQEKGIIIGRGTLAEICFADDLHLSSMHAKICKEAGEIVLKDLGSTNGTWVRLSAEGKPSEQTEIKDNDVIKIGSNLQFMSRIKEKDHSNSNKENQVI